MLIRKFNSGISDKGNLKEWSAIAKGNSFHPEKTVKDDSGAPQNVGRNGDWRTKPFKDHEGKCWVEPGERKPVK